LLYFGCTSHRIDDTGELDKQSIARRFHDAATVLHDFAIDQFATQRLETLKRTFLVCPHQPRIPDHIGGKDRGKTAALAHADDPTKVSRRRSSGAPGYDPLLPGIASCLVGSSTSKFVLYHQGLLWASLKLIAQIYCRYVDYPSRWAAGNWPVGRTSIYSTLERFWAWRPIN
jgi:hypothetical protein